MKEITHGLLLGRTAPTERLARAATRFADRVVASDVYAGALEQIAADRAAGYRLVMATASYRFYALAIGERLGFDDVIGTEAMVDAGQTLSHISGDNCYGAAKLRMIEAWMRAKSVAPADASVRFYSDHVSDAPTLEWADEAFAVNAHGPLRRLAKTRGWTIVDWRR